MAENRCKELLESIPLVTLSLLVCNIIIHGIVFLFTIDLRDFTLHPYRVLYHWEYYRCISAAFLHGSLMHILMNMMTLFSLGPSLERKFGSLQFLFFNLWSVFLCGVLYSSQSWLLSVATGNTSYLMQPAIGFSGILFAYILIECYHTEVQSRTFFGLFSVPTKIYPWIVLIVIQFIMPNISFLGHLSGIWIGLLSVYGTMEILIPSSSFFKSIEDSTCSRVRQFPNFVGDVDSSFRLLERENEGGKCVKIFEGVKWILQMVWNVISTVLYIIGFPVDSCSESLRRWFSQSVNMWNSWSRTLWPVFDRSYSPVNVEEVDNFNDIEYGLSEEKDQDEEEIDRRAAREARLQKFGKVTNVRESI